MGEERKMGGWEKAGEAVPTFSEDQGITTPGGDTEVTGDVGSRGQDVGRVIGVDSDERVNKPCNLPDLTELIGFNFMSQQPK